MKAAFTYVGIQVFCDVPSSDGFIEIVVRWVCMYRSSIRSSSMDFPENFGPINFFDMCIYSYVTMTCEQMDDSSTHAAK